MLRCGFLRPQEQKSAGGALQGDGAFDGKPFLRSDSHIFMAEYDVECADDVQLDDNTLIKQIQQDVRTKDMLSLSEHVDRLFHNYRQNVGFSQIYVKFVFSSLLKVLYEAIPGKTTGT